ncbi:putative transglutaminase-like cysteine proteinase [Bradyrhizobium diazoefficiens]
MFDFRGQGKRLAIAAMLFGISATVQAGENRLLYASLGDTTRAPIGWVEFCADNAAQCQGGPTQPRDIVMSQTAWRDLVKVNRWVNERSIAGSTRPSSL